MDQGCEPTTDSAPTQRRARLRALPGGAPRYKATLDWLLAWIHAASPTVPALRQALAQRFDAGGRGMAEGCLALLEGAGLVDRRAGALTLTDAGVAYCRDPDPAALFERLHAGYLGLLEALALLDFPGVSPAQRRSLLGGLLDVPHRTAADAGIRGGWLRSLGLVARAGARDVLTPLGRRVLAAHAAEVAEIHKRADDLLLAEREADAAWAEAIAWRLEDDSPAAPPGEDALDEALAEAAPASASVPGSAFGAAPASACAPASARAFVSVPAPPRWCADHLDLRPEQVRPHLGPLEIPDRLVDRLCAALASGKHLLLVGPPGTGKTELARALGRAAEAEGYCAGALAATASPDWSTFETVGGYALQRDGALRFRPGVFLAALERRQWLIVDELNRADADRALGELLTVLAGHGTTTPYTLDDGRLVSIGPEPGRTHCVPPAFRLLATLNTWDRAGLFRLSYAAQRRFAVVHVSPPDDAAYARLLTREARRIGPDPALDPAALGALIRLFRGAGVLGVRPVGPAIALDMARYLRRRADAAEGLGEATSLFLLPQLEGLDPEAAAEAHRRIRGALAGVASAEALSEIEGRFAEEAGSTGALRRRWPR